MTDTERRWLVFLRALMRRHLSFQALSVLKIGQKDPTIIPGPEEIDLLLHECQEADVETALQMCDYLVTQNYPEAIDVLCRRWMDTREVSLAQIISQKGYIAREPLNVRVFSALQANRIEVIKTNEVQYIKVLLHACEDRDSTIASRARLALTHLQDVEAQEILCQLVIEDDHVLAREIVLEAHYAPRDPHQRALLYFLTEQWDKYEQLDVDQHLLKDVYPVVDPGVKKRLAARARRAGRLEWTNLVVSGRQEKEVSGMTDEEWDVTLTVFNKNRKWKEIWRLVQMAPAVWSMRLLLRLKESVWMPEQETEREAFTQLVRLAEECGEEEDILAEECRTILRKHTITCMAISPDGQILAGEHSYENSIIQSWRLPDGVILKTLKVEHGSTDIIAISPDGRMLASGGRWGRGDTRFKVRLWRLPDGVLLKTLIGEFEFEDGRYPDSGWQWCDVECLAISPDGCLLACGATFREYDRDYTRNFGSKVWMWRLSDGALLKTLEGCPHCFAISPNGRVLSGGGSCLAFSSDGQMRARGSGDGTVRLESLPSYKLLHTLKGHTKRVTCIAISPDGRLLVSGTEDGTVQLWALWKIRLRRLISEPTHLEHVKWVEDMLKEQKLTNVERKWLEFVLALTRWQRRFDIEVGEAPRDIPGGEFDVELE